MTANLLILPDSINIKDYLANLQIGKLEYHSIDGFKEDHYGKNGIVRVSQELNFSGALRFVIKNHPGNNTDVVGFNFYFKHEFDGYLEGGYSNERTTSGSKATFFAKDFFQNDNDLLDNTKDPNRKRDKTAGGRVGSAKLNGPTLTESNDGTISIGVSAEAALILGVKVNLEAGFRVIRQ